MPCVPAVGAVSGQARGNYGNFFNASYASNFVQPPPQRDRVDPVTFRPREDPLDTSRIHRRVNPPKKPRNSFDAALGDPGAVATADIARVNAEEREAEKKKKEVQQTREMLARRGFLAAPAAAASRGSSAASSATPTPATSRSSSRNVSPNPATNSSNRAAARPANNNNSNRDNSNNTVATAAATGAAASLSSSSRRRGSSASQNGGVEGPRHNTNNSHIIQNQQRQHQHQQRQLPRVLPPASAPATQQQRQPRRYPSRPEPPFRPATLCCGLYDVDIPRTGRRRCVLTFIAICDLLACLGIVIAAIVGLAFLGEYEQPLFVRTDWSAPEWIVNGSSNGSNTTSAVLVQTRADDAALLWRAIDDVEDEGSSPLVVYRVCNGSVPFTCQPCNGDGDPFGDGDLRDELETRGGDGSSNSSHNTTTTTTTATPTTTTSTTTTTVPSPNVASIQINKANALSSPHFSRCACGYDLHWQRCTAVNTTAPLIAGCSELHSSARTIMRLQHVSSALAFVMCVVLACAVVLVQCVWTPHRDGLQCEQANGTVSSCPWEFTPVCWLPELRYLRPITARIILEPVAFVMFTSVFLVAFMLALNVGTMKNERASNYSTTAATNNDSFLLLNASASSPAQHQQQQCAFAGSSLRGSGFVFGPTAKAIRGAALAVSMMSVFIMYGGFVIWRVLNDRTTNSDDQPILCCDDDAEGHGHRRHRRHHADSAICSCCCRCSRLSLRRRSDRLFCQGGGGGNGCCSGTSCCCGIPTFFSDDEEDPLSQRGDHRKLQREAAERRRHGHDAATTTTTTTTTTAGATPPSPVRNNPLTALPLLPNRTSRRRTGHSDDDDDGDDGSEPLLQLPSVWLPNVAAPTPRPASHEHGRQQQQQPALPLTHDQTMLLDPQIAELLQRRFEHATSGVQQRTGTRGAAGGDDDDGHDDAHHGVPGITVVGDDANDVATAAVLGVHPTTLGDAFVGTVVGDATPNYAHTVDATLVHPATQIGSSAARRDRNVDPLDLGYI